MKQGTFLKSSETFTVTPQKGRKFTIKQGEIMMVTSPAYRNNCGCLLDKKTKASIDTGHYFTNEQIKTMFEVVE